MCLVLRAIYVCVVSELYYEQGKRAAVCLRILLAFTIGTVVLIVVDYE